MPVLEASVTKPPIGPPARRPARVSASPTLGLGIAMLWLSLLVLLPLAAVVATATGSGFTAFEHAFSSPPTMQAVVLTLVEALVVTLINVVTGTMIAWVLVRDRFHGCAVVDVVIDVPFALPTIVAGLVLLALYGPHSPIGVDVAGTRYAVLLALAFVTLPFVVRTVQPVLQQLDRQVEEAAACLGAQQSAIIRRIILPALAPAICAGAALSFARCVSEYGSLVLLSGNLPNRTEVVSVRVLTYVENGDQTSAAALATVMLLISLAVVLALDVIQRRAANHG